MLRLKESRNHIYRKALHECFGGFDKYFIPFIRAKQNLNFSGREKKDIDPENNHGMYAVPQILTRNADDFLRTASQLAGLGYREINLNLGCPSKTVVTKGCGAGFLDRPDELERFLNHIFANTDLKISIKTRLGMDDAEEFEDLLEIYNRFPLEELIVHPRVQKDFYKNVPNLEAFEYAVQKSKNPLCYNGDIFSAEDFAKVQERFSVCGLFYDGARCAGVCLLLQGRSEAERLLIKRRYVSFTISYIIHTVRKCPETEMSCSK